MKPLFFVIFILSVGCSNRKKVNRDISPANGNVAVVNYDSCQRWGLPFTSFSVRYPSDYQVQFHSKDEYLKLTQLSDSGVVEREFSFGKCQNVQTKEEIEKWIRKADSAFNMFKTYNTKTIRYENIAGMNLFVVNGIINFDYFGLQNYKGDYRTLMTAIPTHKQTNGVSVSVITKSNNDSLVNLQELNKILGALEFQDK